jgi:hypothetical protein
MNKVHEIYSENQSSTQPIMAISHLHRREIQAPIAACLIRGFSQVMGHAKALQVASAAIQADAMVTGQNLAERYGSNTMLGLARMVREVWAEGNAMTIHFLEETERKLSFNVTRCRYVELYERLGMRELGFCLSCCRDEPLARGFNPRMKLLRTQTIMEGATFCDFRFALE